MSEPPPKPALRQSEAERQPFMAELVSVAAFLPEGHESREELKRIGAGLAAFQAQVEQGARREAGLREALRRIAEEDWDDVDPDDGLHKKSVRAFARAALNRGEGAE